MADVARARVSLRPLRDSDDDYALMVPWLTDQRMLEWVLGRNEVYDLDRVRSEWRLPDLLAEEVVPHFIVLEGRPVGYLQTVRVALHNEGYQAEGDVSRAYAFDLWIGEPALWNSGIGTAACVSAVESLVALGADRVLIDPRVVNERAVHVYEKIGFRKLKVLPANELHEGVGWDCWLMELDLAAFAAFRAE
ncbi:MAG: GNAT family N-acetyltransferase [Ilumatobacteraceae bacterium]